MKLASRSRAWTRDFISQPPVHGRQRFAVVVICLGAVFMIGLLDVSTGADLTLGAVYLFPVALATVAIGLRAGLALVGLTTVVSLAADLIRRTSVSADVHLFNGSLRAVTLLVTAVLLASLRSALDRARASEEQSREFLAFAAHQLRTPIAGVRAAADALVISGVPPAQEEQLRRIASESARSGRLVASLLRVARLDQGEIGPQRACDIRALVADEAERVRARAPHIVVTTDVHASIPQYVRLSPESTQEAVESLLDNARKHARGRIELRVESRDGELWVHIRDDGGGVRPGDEHRIFERFVTLDGLGGSGLGLPIARGLTEQQGGRLEAADGAFVMRLPLRPAPSARLSE